MNNQFNTKPFYFKKCSADLQKNFDVYEVSRKNKNVFTKSEKMRF